MYKNVETCSSVIRNSQFIKHIVQLLDNCKKNLQNARYTLYQDRHCIVLPSIWRLLDRASLW